MKTTLLCLAAVLALPAFAAAQNVPPGAMPGMPGGAAVPALDPAVMKTTTLTDAQVQGFIGAMEDFDALSKKEGGKRKINPSDPADVARAAGNTAEAKAILDKHGFSDLTSFQTVAYNAAMAYSVLQQGGKEVVTQKLDEAKVQQEKAMKQMQQHLSPEQLKAIQGHIGAGMAIADNMRDVPDENLVLMEKYRPQMEKLANR